MPAIPTYQQQSEARGSLDVRPRVATIGGGLQDVGAGLAHVADVLARSREQDAAADAALKIARAQTDWDRQLLDRQEQATPGAPDFMPSLLRDYDAEIDKIVASGKTRLAQEFMSERLKGANRE